MVGKWNIKPSYSHATRTIIHVNNVFVEWNYGKEAFLLVVTSDRGEEKFFVERNELLDIIDYCVEVTRYWREMKHNRDFKLSINEDVVGNIAASAKEEDGTDKFTLRFRFVNERSKAFGLNLTEATALVSVRGKVERTLHKASSEMWERTITEEAQGMHARTLQQQQQQQQSPMLFNALAPNHNLLVQPHSEAQKGRERLD